MKPKANGANIILQRGSCRKTATARATTAAAAPIAIQAVDVLGSSKLGVIYIVLPQEYDKRGCHPSKRFLKVVRDWEIVISTYPYVSRVLLRES